MKLKANKNFKELNNKYFQYGTEKCLLRGGSIVMDEETFKALPKEIQESLESTEKKKTKTKTKTKSVSKKDTIKDRKGDK